LCVPAPSSRALAFAQRITILRAVLVIAGLAVVLTTFGSLLIRSVEPETFSGRGESLWWALQTVSTVGYGDVVPTTGAGRWIGGVLMLLGVALVPAVTAITVAVLIPRLRDRALGPGGGEDAIAARLERIERALMAREQP
jgi:voltage-gated potassium channel